MKVKQEITEILENISVIMEKPVTMGSTIVVNAEDEIVISAYITVSAYGDKKRVITVTNLRSKATLEIAYSAATKKRIEAAILLLQ